MDQLLSNYRFKRAYTTKLVPLEELKATSEIKGLNVGDLVLSRVVQLRRQTRLETPEGRRAYLYEGDLILGVVGKRYSTKHYTGFELPCDHAAQLLTTSGILGCANTKAENIRAATELEIVCRVVDQSGKPVNTKQYRTLPTAPPNIGAHPPVILVVGSDMDSGKTTMASSLLRGLSKNGKRVYSLKLTGSASGPDYWKMSDAGAQHTADFLDAGWVSTSGVGNLDILSIFDDALTDSITRKSDLVIIEVADGLLQPETSLLLSSRRFTDRISGVLLASDTAISAVYGCERLFNQGYTILGVGGVFTKYPVAIEEFSTQCAYPVFTGDVLEDVAGAQMVATSLSHLDAALGQQSKRA